MTKQAENNPQGTANIADDRVLAPVFDSFPLFYCQHKDAQWNCKHYKVVDKDFYSIETKCRFLGIDNETCNSKPCNADACRQFLNGL